MGHTNSGLIEHTPSAAASFAEICQLFGSSRVGMIYDNLDPDIRKTLCFAAGLRQRHVSLRLGQLDHLERVKLHRAINTLAPVISKLSGRSITEFK